MLNHIRDQERRRKARQPYSYKEKQEILKHVTRYVKKGEPKTPANEFISLESYVDDMALIIDHIFSYEFNTMHLDQKNNQDQESEGAYSDDGTNAAAKEGANPYLEPKERILMYREAKAAKFGRIDQLRPKDCESWWDMVVQNFYRKGREHLNTVDFLIEKQEEVYHREKRIELAWIKIALSDYREFVKVYDYITQLGAKKGTTSRVKEMYNSQSYIQMNQENLENLKNTYLNHYDLLQSEHPLVVRYGKYLYDNFAETQDETNQFLIKLQEEHQFNGEDIEDFDFDQFNLERN